MGKQHNKARMGSSLRKPDFLCLTATTTQGLAFGGLRASKVTGDLIAFNFTTFADELDKRVIPAAANVPTPHAHHSAPSSLGRMWVFGGLGTHAGPELSSHSSIGLCSG